MHTAPGPIALLASTPSSIARFKESDGARMPSMASVSVVRDRRFLEHNQGPHHPETPERLVAIDAALERIACKLIEIPARAATRTELERVHDTAHLDRLEKARGQRVVLDPDTSTSAGSVDAALLAAGATIDLAEKIAKKEVPP